MAFGLAVLLFELGESGTNTRLWQAVVGWVLPVVLFVGAALRAGSLERSGRRLRQLAVATVGGVLLGFAILWWLS